MPLEQLTHEEKKIVFACLCAIAKGPFIHTGEIRSRSGGERHELYKLIEKWPDIDDSEGGVWIMLNGVMNEISHGVQISPEECDAWFGVDRDAVTKVFRKWKDNDGSV